MTKLALKSIVESTGFKPEYIAMSNRLANLGVESAELYPRYAEALPDDEISDGRYLLRYAKTAAELDAILKLRFEVFNLELGEGLAESYLTGRDRDQFDDVCHHLIVTDTTTNEAVGTYRIQTGEMAAQGAGFYTSGEFDLSRLPQEIIADAVELGRACIAKQYRNTRVLFLLWKGLARYIAHNRKRYLFGCCSLTSQDPSEGLRAMNYLRRAGYVLPDEFASPLPGFECEAQIEDNSGEFPLPPLFRIYLRYGAKVCGPPVIDREFKTIDFLALLDVEAMDARTRSAFFT